MKCEIRIDSEEHKLTARWIAEAFPNFSKAGIKDTIITIVNELNRYPSNKDEALAYVYLTKRIESADTLLSRSKVEYQIQKATEDKKTIYKAKQNATKNQKITLNRLEDMLNKYIVYLKKLKVLEDAGESTSKIRGRSVSTAKGSTIFANPKQYKQYNLFGQFVHHYVEKVMEKHLKGEKELSPETISQRLDDENYFYKVLDEWESNTDNMFLADMNGLTRETIYEMIKKVSQQYIFAEMDNANTITLPEMTIFGEDLRGRPITGRVDSMIITDDGSIKIIDYKTKKASSGAKFDKLSDNEKYGATVRALDSSVYTIDSATSDPLFKEETRGVFADWGVQTRIYERILLQNDIDISESLIVALVYFTDRDSMFKHYNVITNKPSAMLQGAKSASNIKSGEDAFRKQIEKADKLIPLEPIKEKIIEEKETAEYLPFDTDKKQWEKIKTSLLNFIKKDKDTISKERSKVKRENNNPALIELYDTMLKGLNDFEQSVLNDNESIASSIKISNAINNLESIVLGSLVDSTEISNVISNLQNFFDSNNKELTDEYKMLLQNMSTIKDKIFSTHGIFKLLEELVNEAINKKHITYDSLIAKRIKQLEDSYKLAESYSIKANMWTMALVTKKLVVENIDFNEQGERVDSLARLERDIKEALEPKLNALKREKEKIETTGSASVQNYAKEIKNAFINKFFKNKAKERLTPSANLAARRIDEINLEIASIEAYMLMPQKLRSVDGIMELIDNITDPASTMYLGMPMDINSFGDSIPFGSDVIASITSSDPLIAAHTKMLKWFEAQSRYNVTNDPNIKAHDKMLESLKKKGKTEQQMNNAITEERTVMRIDDKGEINKDKKQISLIQPASEEFNEYFRTHKPGGIHHRMYKKKLAELNSTLRSSIGAKAIKDVKRQITELKDAENKRVKEFKKFEKEMTHTYFSKKFYEYQLKVNDDISAELKEKYEEIFLLLDRTGTYDDEIRMEQYRQAKFELPNYDEFDSQEEIDNELITDYDRINQLYVEIKKLREKSRNSDESDKALKLFTDLFEIKINQTLFNRIYAQKDNEYADRETNPISQRRFQDWLDENSAIVPTEEWYNTVGAIYDRMAEVSSEDLVFKNLNNKRRNLLKRYKLRNNIVDPRYISEEDYLELLTLENDLSRHINSKKGKANPEIFLLTEELNKLRTKVDNPIYKRDMQGYTERLQKALNYLTEVEEAYENANSDDIAEAEKAYMFAKEMFVKEEENYAAWYNKNHDNEYQSIRKSNPLEYAVPSSLNKMYFPTSEFRSEYTTRMPSGKYTYRVLKDAAKNPNYQESMDASRLPIALKREGDTITLNDEYFNDELIPDEQKQRALSLVNPNYLTLMKDKEMFEFYKTTTKAFFSIQKRMKGRVSGYLIPGMNRTIIETYRDNSLTEAMKISGKDFYDNFVKIKSQDDMMLNTYNDDPTREVRSRFSGQYEEGLQSTDAISAIRAWMIEGHYNIAMSEIQPISKSFIAGLRSTAEGLTNAIDRAPDNIQRQELSSRLKNVEDALRISEAEHEKFVRGYTDDESNRAFKEITTNLMKMFSIARIGFDIANQTKNFISGNVQLWMNSQSSNHWSADDLRWAKGEMYGNFFKKYLRSWGKLDEVDPEVQLYRASQPAQNDIRKYALDIAGSKSRRILNKVLSFQEIAYFLQDKGDKEIAMTIWLAIMHNKKVRLLDKDGNPMRNPDGTYKMISLYNAVDISTEGYITVKPNVDATLDHIIHWTMVAQNEIIKTQGNYAASDKTRIERTVPGTLLMFYRKYLIPMFLNRLGSMRPDWISNEVQYGYYRALFTVWKEMGTKETMKALLFSGVYPKKFRKSTNMSNFYSRKMMQLSRDLTTSFVFLSLVMLSQAYLAAIDDDEEVDMISGNIIRVLWGVDREVRSMNPIPIVGGTDEYIRNFTTFTTITREFQMVSRSISHLMALLFVKGITLFNGRELLPEDDPDNLLEQIYAMAHKWSYYSRKSGVYEEGDPKLLKDFHDLSGYKNINSLLNPGEKLEQMSKTYF